LSDTSSRLTSDANTIPAAFHNLNNAASFLQMVATTEEESPEDRERAMHYALALSRTHNTVAALREIAQVVATHYADDGHAGAVGCKWCRVWLVNDSESLEDQHNTDCPVLKARTLLGKGGDA
jgi:hypothetical protein